eukprot:g24275.t1
MERRRREEWQRHEEELQRRAEEDKRKAEDEQKRREEEAKVLRQQQATLSVLRVLQKLSNASPDDFESLNKELEEVLNTELPETGAQQEILKAEADRVLEYAKQYVEQVREQQKKWEELREQQSAAQENSRTAQTRPMLQLLCFVAQLAVVAATAHQDAPPSHAGCFVSNGTTMLAVKLTYDGYLFDIPGGRTDGHEPAQRTAERETFEESGYQVSIGELLATVRGGFNIYKCYLQDSIPHKGPDHEVSLVKWMDASEIEGHLQHHEWRFQDDQARFYLDWLQGNNGQHPPEAGEHEMEVVEVLKLCRTVEKTGKSAMTSCQACLDLVAEKKATIEEAENIRAEAQQVISQVQPRVQAATRLVSDALAKAKDNKERIAGGPAGENASWSFFLSIEGLKMLEYVLIALQNLLAQVVLLRSCSKLEEPGWNGGRMPPQRLPRGILPEGIDVPEGTDIMQFCRDLAESGAQFAEQFDRSHPKFHGGNPTAVPLGGDRVPESLAASMGGEAEVKNWRDLPDAPLSLEDDYGPDYKRWMDAHKTLNDCKKAIAVVNKPVEVAMKLRVQYTEAEGEDKSAYQGRLKGAENDRDGALDAATATILGMSPEVISERCRSCVEDVVKKGKFEFIDKETYGEFIQILKRANQDATHASTNQDSRINSSPWTDR